MACPYASHLHVGSRPLVKRPTGAFISPLFSDLALQSHAASIDTFVTVSGPSRHQYHPQTDTHWIVASQSPSSTGAGRAACIAGSGAFAFKLRVQTLPILVGASALQARILRHPPTEAGDVYTESRTRLLSWYSQGHAVGIAINLTQPPTQIMLPAPSFSRSFRRIIIALLYPASLLTYSLVVDGVVLQAVPSLSARRFVPLTASIQHCPYQLYYVAPGLNDALRARLLG
ncbi:hypothetical protein BDZ89DRAFT_1134442 [Hymenopellis radicata]|nr:hypothetical protein BDZ89DRAFT_1134442 [Hymenopellis radicata]